MPIVLEGLGTVTPLATITVQSQISGYLLQVDFTEGQDVKRGDQLALVDPRPYQATLEQYQAQLARDTASYNQAKMDLARYQALGKQASIAKQTLDDQVYTVAQDAATLKVDQAQIDTEKLDLEYCHVRAPRPRRVRLRPRAPFAIAFKPIRLPWTAILSVEPRHFALFDVVEVRYGDAPGAAIGFVAGPAADAVAARAVELGATPLPALQIP